MIVGACALTRAQVSFPAEEIHYNVKYHWGIIDVMIARGSAVVQADGNSFYGTLDGTSIPWEGKIICVSDTLQANITGSGNNLHESVQYQNGWYRHPKVADFRSPRYNPDDPANYKNIAGQGAYNASNDSMEAITITADMLSMYYFAHAIDFPSMSPGQQVTIPIDGQYSNEVVITYNGEGIYSDGNNNYPTYDCTFQYGYEGSPSVYPVKCKIGRTTRVPVYFSASLPVGEVEMLYEP